MFSSSASTISSPVGLEKPIALQYRWELMENWATIKFAPGRVQTVPEEFTEIHNALMMVSLACLPRMSAENPDSGVPFSQARAKGAREALSRFQMAGLTLTLSGWGATLSPRGWRESLNGTCEGGWSVSPCSLAAERGTLLQDILVAGFRGATRSCAPRGERLCGECWTSGYTSKVATETSIFSSHIIGEVRCIVNLYCEKSRYKKHTSGRPVVNQSKPNQDVSPPLPPIC